MKVGGFCTLLTVEQGKVHFLQSGDFPPVVDFPLGGYLAPSGDISDGKDWKAGGTTGLALAYQ